MVDRFPIVGLGRLLTFGRSKRSTGVSRIVRAAAAAAGGAQIKGQGLFDLNMDLRSPFLKALRARRSPRRLVREGCE